jgi:Fuc2NAc and GlcNAc transferase
MNTPAAWVLGLAFLVSLAFAMLVKACAARVNLLDQPNHRSSHAKATPRGGGLGLVVVITVTLFFWKDLPWQAAACAAAIGMIGLLDDLMSVPALARLLTQLTASTVLLSSLEPGLHLPGMASWALGLAGVFFICWITNLYNFMDGIDGLAGLQAFLATMAIALLSYLGLAPKSLAFPALPIAASAAGFMLMNFPPAKLFMGDTGSAFLGFVFAALALVSLELGQQFFWVWLILIAVFVTDATMTLVVRLLRGEKIYEAHRSHLYQRLTAGWQKELNERGKDESTARTGAHRRYLAWFTAVFILFQLPAGWAIFSGLLSGWLAALLVYAPLALIHLMAGSGRRSVTTPS